MHFCWICMRRPLRLLPFACVGRTALSSPSTLHRHLLPRWRLGPAETICQIGNAARFFPPPTPISFLSLLRRLPPLAPPLPPSSSSVAPSTSLPSRRLGTSPPVLPSSAFCLDILPPDLLWFIDVQREQTNDMLSKMSLKIASSYFFLFFRSLIIIGFFLYSEAPGYFPFDH